MSSFSDKSGQCRGSAKDGVIQVWLKDMRKTEFCASVTLAEIDRALGVHGNSNYVLWSIAERIIGDASDRWIEGTKDPVLREKRRYIDANDTTFGRAAPLHSRQIDSAARVLRALYKAETGRAPASWFERAKSNA